MSTNRPVYLLAGGRPGGGRSSESIFNEIIKESGSKSPLVAYTGAASGDDTGFFRRMTGMLAESGVSRVKHAVLVSPRADIAEAKSILESADIIFIGGGDVDAGMRILDERNMTRFLRELYERGKLFFGTSAGAIMLASEWVRWRNHDDSSTAELFPCLDLAPIICDCHDEESGWEELKAALELKENGTRGFGLAAGSAVKVFPDGRIEVLSGTVHPHIRKDGIIKRMPDMIPGNHR